MVVEEIKSEEEFTNAIKGGEISLVHFWAPWAQECPSMNEAMEVLSKGETRAKFYKLEAEDVGSVSLAHEVLAVPTFLFFKRGKPVGRVDGAHSIKVTKMLESLLSEAPSSADVRSPPPPSEKEEIQSRLKSLVNSSPVMLFMKGNPQEPKCGFSRSIVNILDSFKAQYSSFDILQDEVVRQALKEYSKWPTYPQLYIKGELIGGLDIVVEMKDNGDLQSLLPLKNQPVKLEELVRRSPIMVFMKGNPDHPKCGFSRQLVELFRSLKVTFDHFDILLDEDVRSGLKIFSNWPTYPQVYVKGELIGGLDIIKELNDSNELLSTLKD